MLSYVREQWAEGERHGFPKCCRARYIADRLLDPVGPRRLLPDGLGGRLVRLRPRYSVADGMVPCEAHLLGYLLTGDRSGWRKPRAPGMCCQLRADIVAGGYARLTRETFCPTDDDGEELDEVTVWMLGEGDGAISVTHCPWCGAALDEV